MLDWVNEGDGLGVDGVIDAAGVSAMLNMAINRPPDRVDQQGGRGSRRRSTFRLDPLVQKNIPLQGSFSHNWPIWKRVIRLLATGKLDVQPIIGGVWPWSDGTAIEDNAQRVDREGSIAAVRITMAPIAAIIISLFWCTVAVLIAEEGIFAARHCPVPGGHYRRRSSGGIAGKIRAHGLGSDRQGRQ